MYAKKENKQKQNFPMASCGDLLLNGKQKKPFVLLKGEVTINNTLISQVDEALNGPDSNLFCPDAGPIQG